MPKKLTPSNPEHLPVLVRFVERRIHSIRGHNVMLAADLAELYEVLTKNLNKAVARNRDRFPEDFMFQLTRKEIEGLRFQIGTSKIGRGGRRYLPYAFTEQGVAMLSSVLNSKRAIQVNITIMRAFVQMRALAGTHKNLEEKIDAMEKRYDGQFSIVFRAIKKLIEPPARRKRQIGFRTDS